MVNIDAHQDASCIRGCEPPRLFLEGKRETYLAVKLGESEGFDYRVILPPWATRSRRRQGTSPNEITDINRSAFSSAVY